MSKLTKGILISLGAVSIATFAVIGAGVYFMINESSDEFFKNSEKFFEKLKGVKNSDEEDNYS